MSCICRQSCLVLEVGFLSTRLCGGLEVPGALAIVVQCYVSFTMPLVSGFCFSCVELETEFQ